MAPVRRHLVSGLSSAIPLAALAVRIVGAAVYRQHDHLGADVDAGIEVCDVFIGEADATGRNPGADGLRRIGAVNPVDRAAEVHRACAERIAGTAGHLARQIGLARDHFRGRGPIRPLGLLANRLYTRPGKTLAADADAVADRPPAAEHVIEIGVGGIDDDGAGRLAGGVADDLP